MSPWIKKNGADKKRQPRVKCSATLNAHANYFTMSLSMTTSLRDLSSGSLYIISSMSDSIIERSARAPVPNFKAFSAIASTAPSVNLNFAPSRAKSFVYWRMREFFVFVRMWTKSDFERGFRVETTGSLPINSGINPN